MYGKASLLLLMKEDLKGAMQLLNGLLVKQPNDPRHAELWFLKGQIHLKSRESDDARGCFKKAERFGQKIPEDLWASLEEVGGE